MKLAEVNTLALQPRIQVGSAGWFVQEVLQGLGPLREQIQGHLLGQLLGIAGPEHVGRVPNEHEDWVGEVVVDERVRGESCWAAHRALLARQGVREGVRQPLRADRVVTLEAALRIEPVEPEVWVDDLPGVLVDVRHGEVEELAELINGQAGLGLNPEFLQVLAEQLLPRAELHPALAIGAAPFAVAVSFGERRGEQVAAVLDELDAGNILR